MNRDKMCAIWLWLLLVAAPLGCQTEYEPAPPSTNSNSNWLVACSQDADCASDTTCACGFCVASCERAADCGQSRPEAACAPPGGQALDRLCGGAGQTPGAVCLPGCAQDADCPQGWSCLEQACAPPACQEGTQVCASQLGLEGGFLYLCDEDGAWNPAQACELGCLTLDDAQAACVTYDCDTLPQGQYCGSELALPTDFWFDCSGGQMSVLGTCQDCTPGRGAATCR
jgi:hypothetical protein